MAAATAAALPRQSKRALEAFCRIDQPKGDQSDGIRSSPLSASVVDNSKAMASLTEVSRGTRLDLCDESAPSSFRMRSCSPMAPSTGGMDRRTAAPSSADPPVDNRSGHCPAARIRMACDAVSIAKWANLVSWRVFAMCCAVSSDISSGPYSTLPWTSDAASTPTLILLVRTDATPERDIDAFDATLASRSSPLTADSSDETAAL
mmetsp:Transcript_28681/g.67360  ORF Transcript_28681/g.67360 Transcript_28681/m.67360 type:complete len:205 (+) Transcript_28681:1500-2114(+)